MKKLLIGLAALCALNASAQSDELTAKIMSNKIKIVAFGESGWDARWREPTCSVTKTEKDELGRPYMYSHYDMCTCQNSIAAKYLIEDTQDNPQHELFVCYVNN